MRSSVPALIVGVLLAAGGIARAAEEPAAELRIWCLAQVKTNEAADVLIARAGELAGALRAAKAGDKTWNDVIQIYDAVLQQYPDALYGVGDNVYVMASAFCRDRILEFPKDGLEAYTAIADAEADRKLRAAREAADPVALRDVALRYFPTSSGDDACYELANHYLESGQYAAALAALRRIDDHPAPDVNRAAVWIRKAICLRRTGRVAELAELLRNPPKNVQEFEAAGRTWKIADFLATEFDRLTPFRADELRAEGAWPMQGGNEHNDARVPELSSKFRKLWSFRLPDPFNDSTNPASPQQFFPVATDDTVYVLTNSHLVGVWALSGVERWRFAARWTSRGRAIGPAIAGSVVYGTFANFTRRSEDLLIEIGRRLWAFDARTGSVVWDYVEPNIAMSYRITPNSQSPPIAVGNRLYAYQFREEKKIWRPWGGNHPTLVCLDAASGRVLWETALAVVPNEGRVVGRHCDGSVPVEHGGTIYVQTNCGVIGAVDASSGGILWLKRYNQVYAAIRQDHKYSRGYVSWWHSLPVVYAGVLYVAPTDADALYGIDAATGRTVLSIPNAPIAVEVTPAERAQLRLPPEQQALIERHGDKAEIGLTRRSRQLLGVDEAHLYLAEDETLTVRYPDEAGGKKESASETCSIAARDRSTGAVRWRHRLGCLMVGTPAMSATALYVPTERSIQCVRLDDGRPDPERTIPLSEPAEAGNLIAFRTSIGTLAVTCANSQVNLYCDRDEVMANARRMQRDEPQGAGRFIEAEVLLAGGDRAAALKLYTELAEYAPTEAKYGGEPVRLFARDRVFQVNEAQAREADRAGDAARAVAAWKTCAACARTDDQAATALLALAKAQEAAGQTKDAVDTYQAILASGTRAVRECAENLTCELRPFAVRSVARLIRAAGADIYAAHEREAAALIAKKTTEALHEAVVRFPNAAGTPGDLERLIRETADARLAIRLAGQLLAVLPENESAKRIAPDFLGSAGPRGSGPDYANPGAVLPDTVGLLWSLPKDEQDRLTCAFFLYETPVAGAARALRQLIGVQTRGQNESCNLQCVDVAGRRVLWETTLVSPKVQPATITAVALARGGSDGAGFGPGGSLIVAATGADVFGVHPETGHVLWRYSPRSVVKHMTASGRCVAVALDDEVVGLDAATGARLWGHVIPGYAYDGPHIYGGHVAVLTCAPSRIYVFDLLGGTLIADRKVVDLHSRAYYGGPWIAAQGSIIGILSGGSLHGYNLTTGGKLWSTEVRFPNVPGHAGQSVGAGIVWACGPWFCVTPGRGYGFQVGGAKLIEPASGRVVWEKDFPHNQPRGLATGGNCLDATDRHVLCTWLIDQRTGEAVVDDIREKKTILSYRFPCHGEGGLDKAAFLGRILDRNAAVFTSKSAEYERTVYMHLIDKATGKGTMQTLEAGKSGEHGGYGGFAARPLGKALLVSTQSGLFCYGEAGGDPASEK